MFGGKRIIVWLTFEGWLKIAFVSFVILVAMYILLVQLPNTQTWKTLTLPLSGKIIAIDPGHGKPDGGAVSKEGITEAEINLHIANYLRDYLQEAGALVVMTREDEHDLADPGMKGLSRRKRQDLFRRVELIEKKKAELLVSIHLNSIPSSRWHGAQTFYFPKNKENERLAALIQQEIRENLQTDRVALKVDNVFLLKAVHIPAVLVEAGFLSNPEEARKLANKDYQKKVAATIYRGILRFVAGETIGPA